MEISICLDCLEIVQLQLLVCIPDVPSSYQNAHLRFPPSDTLGDGNTKSLQKCISEQMSPSSVYAGKNKKKHTDNKLLTSGRTHFWKIWLFWVNMNISVSSGIFSIVSISFFPFLGKKHRWIYNKRTHRQKI